ncbi:DNA-binding protein [Aerococcaceae bacterium NML191219]|nr:DNA-binding protein [Aerococcaceae bacterium NML191219]
MGEALLSEQASNKLVEGLLLLIEQKVDERLKAKECPRLNQQEVMKEYKCTHEKIKHWEMLGLKKRRQGRCWVYDRKDIDAVLEKEKQ